MTLRLATADDLALVKAINDDAYAVYEREFGFRPQPLDEDWAPRIAAGQAWLLGEDGTLVIERHPDHALIYSVALRPGAQGGGLGRALLDHAERLAASWGVPELRLYTNALMTKNIALYGRRGYRETGRRTHPKRPDLRVVDIS